MEAAGISLSSFVEQATTLQQVRKTDVHSGDVIYVKTNNSTYAISVVKKGLYAVSGGWFDKHNCSRVALTINGCTWGGSVIKIDILAACGLCIEFGNKVTTSAIKKIIVLKHEYLN